MKLNATLNSLNAVRGFCSLFIVVGHFFTSFAPPDPSKWPTISFEYFQAVTLFFLLSGIMLALLHSSDELTSKQDRFHFWKKRFVRIAPLYYLSLVLQFWPFFAYTNDSLSFYTSIAFSPLFLQSLTLVGNSWSGPMWQLSSLALCYALFPFIVRFVEYLHRSTWKLVITMFLCYTLPLGAMIVFLMFDLPAGMLHVWFPVRVAHFILGVAVGVIARSRFCEDNTVSALQSSKNLNSDSSIQAYSTFASASQNEAQQSRRRSGLGWNLASDACTVLMAGSLGACVLAGSTYGPAGWFAFMLIAEFACVPLHLCWLYSLMHSENSWCGFTVTVFTKSLPQYLGQISFAVYALHYPVLYFYTWIKYAVIVPMQQRDRHIHVGNDTMVDGLYALDNHELFAILALVIVLAQLAYHYIEEPIRKLVK